MDKVLWEKCVKFHGHECPGLAIGFKVCEAAKQKLNINLSQDEEIVCVSENDTCAVDAIQSIFSCTAGKGNLLFHNIGKMAFSFYNRKDNSSIRICLKDLNDSMYREEKRLFILNSSVDDLFDYSKPKFELPNKAVIFKTVICEKCNEGVAEHMIRIQDGRKVCLDCYEEYSRNV